MGSLDNIKLDFNELPDFALHINKLRCLAPAAIQQAVGRHNTRRCGRRMVLTRFLTQLSPAPGAEEGPELVTVDAEIRQRSLHDKRPPPGQPSTECAPILRGNPN
jgi:hypothetical protein